MPSRSEQVYFHQQGDVVHLGWFDAQARGWTPAEGEVMLLLTVEGMDSHEGAPFTLTGVSEATDTRGVVHSNVQLEVPRLSRHVEQFVSEVYPNPTTGPLSIRLNLPEAGRVEVVLIDVTGKTLSLDCLDLCARQFSKGVHLLNVSTGHIPPGNYSIMIAADCVGNQFKNHHKLVINK